MNIVLACVCDSPCAVARLSFRIGQLFLSFAVLEKLATSLVWHLVLHSTDEGVWKKSIMAIFVLIMYAKWEKWRGILQADSCSGIPLLWVFKAGAQSALSPWEAVGQLPESPQTHSYNAMGRMCFWEVSGKLEPTHSRSVGREEIKPKL